MTEEERKAYNRARSKAYYQAHKDERRAYSLRWAREHAEQRREYNAKWHEENKERRKEYKEAYRAEHKEEIRKYNLKWIAEHPDYWQEHLDSCRAASRKCFNNHKEQRLEYARRRRESNPDLMRYYYHLRRTRRRNAPGIDYITPEKLFQRWEYYGNRCYICDAPATATDHVKPLARGGAEYPCNLRPICKSCNSRKGAKWPYESV
jgi:5-methylcytosine-specific restriction endonuclease McrA